MLRDPLLKALVALLVAIAGLYLTGLLWSIALQFADIIVMLVIAWLVSFALEPVVQTVLTSTKLARHLAVALVYLSLLIVLSLAIILIVPVVALQASQIGLSLPSYVEAADRWLREVDAGLPRQGIVSSVIGNLDYSEISRSVQAIGPALVNNAVGLATGVASVLFNLILVLMFSYYFMLDGARLMGGLLAIVPKDRRDELNYLIFSLHRAFGGYLRGQIIQAAIYGVGTAAVMIAAELNYTAVAAIFAAVVMMIPFIGPFIALLPPLAISLFVHPDRAWWVLVLLLALQQVVLNVVAPRVMGRSVGVHPVIVLLALLVGAKLAGIWGALFAVPVAGTVVAMISFYRMSVEERKERSSRVVEGLNGQSDPIADG